MAGVPSITGHVGLIRWAHFNAAAIEGYTVTRGKDYHHWSLRATVVTSDRFKMSQKPLVFVAPHENGEWRFAIRDLEYRGDGPLTAEVGPPEDWKKTK